MPNPHKPDMNEPGEALPMPPRARANAPFRGKGLEGHYAIINKWLEIVTQIPEVKAVWLVGSLTYNTATPCSDIDLFMAVDDEAYDRLWGSLQAKIKMLEGFAPYHPMGNAGFVRVLSETGIVIELGVHKVSELNDLSFYFSWEFLLCRLPQEPQFTAFSHENPQDGWPCRHELSPQIVAKFSQEAMFELAYIAAPFYNHEYESAVTCIDKARLLFLRVLYRHLGLKYAKKYKHLSTVLPVDYLAHYRMSFVQGTGKPEFGPLAEAAIRTFTLMGQYLQEMSERAGGGVDEIWFNRILTLNKTRLQVFMDNTIPVSEP